MANLLGVAGTALALAAGAASPFVATRNSDPTVVPAWVAVPADAQVERLTADREAGSFELHFTSTSDEALTATQHRLRMQGFRISDGDAGTGVLSRALVADGAGRHIEIVITQAPDHDVWRIAYRGSEAG